MPEEYQLPSEILFEVLEEECGGLDGEKFKSCVKNVLVRKTGVPIKRNTHIEWEHRDDNFMYWLGQEGMNHYFGMATRDWEQEEWLKKHKFARRGKYYTMTKAFTYLKDKKEYDNILHDKNFDWMNTQNDTYVLVDSRPEHRWDTEKGEFVGAKQ